MKKADFLSLLLGVAGVLLFGIGMCMCLLPEWNAFREGVVLGAVGAVLLLALLVVRRKLAGKPPIRLSVKTVTTAALGLAGALTLGVGMCMCMVWEGMMLWGVLVGVLGILLLLCLIPLCMGLK